MCSAFEEILKHGLKPNWFGQGSATFWPIVRKISRKQAIECVDGYVRQFSAGLGDECGG